MAKGKKATVEPILKGKKIRAYTLEKEPGGRWYRPLVIEVEEDKVDKTPIGHYEPFNMAVDRSLDLYLEIRDAAYANGFADE